MNFSNQFTDLWHSKFDQSEPPQLEFLKADHFSSLHEQKQALEYEYAKHCNVIDELKDQITRESVTTEFLQRCILKLGAVSQVFNELDQCDSKSSSSSGTSRHPRSSVSPLLSANGTGTLHCSKGMSSNSCSNFSLFPQCIASSLMHSASPLLAAAAATSAPFVIPQNLSQFPAPDTLKLDPDTESMNDRTANFFLSNSSRGSYSAISRLSTPSSFYANQFAPSVASFASTFTPPRRTQASYDEDTIDPSKENCPAPRIMDDCNNQEAHAAAAAVAAALGLDFSTVKSSTSSGSNQLSLSLGSNSVNLDQNSNLRRASVHSLNGMDSKDDDQSSIERPYQCSTCSRSFAVKAGLVQHMRTHTNERPYPCLHCGRAFKQKIQLTTHMRVHSGERPYGCRLCGKLFRQQSHVVQHLRTHTGEKPHKCYQCGKAFRQKYSLISHQRRMCRNRSASNPIAAGMTMWISPGVGGDTCNLVKEFTPAKTDDNVSGIIISSSGSTFLPLTSCSMHSPFSPYHTSPISNIRSSVSAHVSQSHLFRGDETSSVGGVTLLDHGRSNNGNNGNSGNNSTSVYQPGANHRHTMLEHHLSSGTVPDDDSVGCPSDVSQSSSGVGKPVTPVGVS